MHEQRSSRTEWTNNWRTKKSKSREPCAVLACPIKPQVFHPKNLCKFQVYPILGILASLGTGLHKVWGHSVSFQAFASGDHFFATLQSTPSRAATPCSVHTQPLHTEPIKKRSRLLMHNCLGMPWLVEFLICSSTCSMHQNSPCLASEKQPCLDQNGTQFRQGEVEQYWQ